MIFSLLEIALISLPLRSKKVKNDLSRPKSILPPNRHGQVNVRNIPVQGTFAVVFHEQLIDESPEAVKLSLKGYTGTVRYTVKLGDTLQGIAALFDVSPQKIAAWNNMQERADVFAGQKLYISPDERREASPSGQIIVMDEEESKGSPARETAQTLIKISDGTFNVGELYWNYAGKKGQQQLAYEMQKLLKKKGHTYKTRDIKGWTKGALKWGGRALGATEIIFGLDEFRTATNAHERIDAGTNVLIDAAGIAHPYTGAFALYWDICGEWLYKKWREGIMIQMEFGIEGYAASMPFK